MLLLLYTALSSAFARSESIIRCGPLAVQSTLPASGQIDVPTDARLVALLYGCRDPVTFLIELLDDDGRLLVRETQTVSEFNGKGLLVLTLEGGMAPNSEHLLRVTPEDRSAVTEVTFTTGDGLVQGLGGAVPRVTMAEVWTDRGNRERFVSGAVIVSPAPDPDQLSLVGILSDDDRPDSFREITTAPGTSDVWLYDVKQVDEWPEELCLEVVQIDGRGVETEPVEACAPVERRGCTTVPAAPGFFAAALALLGLRRRTSQRGHCVA